MGPLMYFDVEFKYLHINGEVVYGTKRVMAESKYVAKRRVKHSYPNCEILKTTQVD